MNSFTKLSFFVLVCIFFVFCLNSNIVHAQETTQVAIEGENLQAQEEPNKASQILEKEVQLPEGLKKIANVLFKLKPEDNLNTQFLITSFCLILLFALIFYNGFQLVSSFDKATALLAAIVFSLIVSAIGAIREASLFLLSFGEGFSLVNKIGPFRLILIIIILVIVFTLISIVTRMIKEALVLSRAVSDGAKAGAEIAKLKAMAEAEGRSKP